MVSHAVDIALISAYGQVVECEHVEPAEFAGALRRFYNRAMMRPNSVVVLDGIEQTRNSFLEFVRYFNQTAARQR